MKRRLISLILCLAASLPALAHLMPAQRGTLNFLGSDVFAVIALPVSVFDDLDDDGSGRVNLEEFNAHRGDVSASVREAISLDCSHASYRLVDVVLSPELSHGTQDATIEQLTVLGRFELSNAFPQSLSLRVDFVRSMTQTQRLTVTARRHTDGWKRVVTLTPRSPVAVLIPPP